MHKKHKKLLSKKVQLCYTFINTILLCFDIFVVKLYHCRYWIATKKAWNWSSFSITLRSSSCQLHINPRLIVGGLKALSVWPLTFGVKQVAGSGVCGEWKGLFLWYPFREPVNPASAQSLLIKQSDPMRLILLIEALNIKCIHYSWRHTLKCETVIKSKYKR